jgi:serine/threonine-protein kinase RsbW
VGHEPHRLHADGAAGGGHVHSHPAGGHVPPRSFVAVDVDIPSDVAQIEGVVALVTDSCRALHLQPRLCSLNIPVALTEALSNAIIRGNGEDPRKHVHLRATVYDRALVFDITDDGPGFDMSGVDYDASDPAQLYAEDGRGIFLMRRLMDRVEQLRGPRHVVRLTLNR